MSNVRDLKVLVTGGAGFLARHILQRLYDLGVRVATTVRNLDKHPELLSALELPDGALPVFACDLNHDSNWPNAVASCTHVIHCASPFPIEQPRDPETLVRPALDGTRRILRYAQQAGVRRVVMTSSMNAIAGGRAKDATKIYTEADWTSLDDRLTPYDRSKTLAEQAAWEFYASHPDLEIAVINPGAIFGPLIGTQVSASGAIIRSMLRGGIPGVPRIGFGVVDARDVADAHIAAMLKPEAVGRRYICSLDELWLVDIARILAQEYTSRGFKIPTKQLPDWLVRLGASVSPDLRRAADHLARRRRIDNSAVRALLGRDLIASEATIKAMADSLIEKQLVN